MRREQDKVQNTLIIIDGLVQEHEAIKGHMKSVSANRDYLIQIISHLGQLIQEREIKEDRILQLLKRQ